MKIKTKTVIDMDFTDREIEILEDASDLFNWIELELRKFKDKEMDIPFSDINYSYADFNKMSNLLCDMVNEKSSKNY